MIIIHITCTCYFESTVTGKGILCLFSARAWQNNIVVLVLVTVVKCIFWWTWILAAYIKIIRRTVSVYSCIVSWEYVLVKCAGNSYVCKTGTVKESIFRDIAYVWFEFQSRNRAVLESRFAYAWKICRKCQIAEACIIAVTVITAVSADITESIISDIWYSICYLYTCYIWAVVESVAADTCYTVTYYYRLNIFLIAFPRSIAVTVAIIWTVSVIVIVHTACTCYFESSVTGKGILCIFSAIAWYNNIAVFMLVTVVECIFWWTWILTADIKIIRRTVSVYSCIVSREYVLVKSTGNSYTA